MVNSHSVTFSLIHQKIHIYDFCHFPRKSVVGVVVVVSTTVSYIFHHFLSFHIGIALMLLLLLLLYQPYFFSLALFFFTHTHIYGNMRFHSPFLPLFSCYIFLLLFLLLVLQFLYVSKLTICVLMELYNSILNYVEMLYSLCTHHHSMEMKCNEMKGAHNASVGV